MNSTTRVELRPLRYAGAVMLGVGGLWNALPMHPPSCPMLRMTGIPCPLCGSSRAAVATMRGHFIEGLRWNPIGVIAVLVAIALLASWLAGWRPRDARVPVWLPVVMLSATGIYNIAFNPNF